MERTANISDCKQYRYSLTRRWQDGPCLAFIMLNPSTADASVDDATIRKCIGFAKKFGYSAIEVANLFAFRATKPRDMLAAADPVGPLNDTVLLGLIQRNHRIICAWGGNASKSTRPAEVLNMLRAHKVETHCLHVTKDGAPGHPLMLSYDRQVMLYPQVFH